MKKLHYLEALSSALVVGLGQIIRGETNKGLLLLLTFYFALPAVTYSAFLIKGYLSLYIWAVAVIIGIIIWIYSVGEALLKK